MNLYDLKFLTLFAFLRISSSEELKDRHFIVRKSKGIPVFVNETGIKCYHYTWLGPKTSATTDADLNKNCNDFDEEAPCFEPLIYTTGPNKENGPNTTAVEEACATSSKCNPLCELTGSDKCIKLVYYKSSEGGIDSAHSFCGTVKGVPPIDGCHTQYSRDGGGNVKVCFCSTDRCNSSPLLQNSLLLFVFPIALTIYFVEFI